MTIITLTNIKMRILNYFSLICFSLGACNEASKTTDTTSTENNGTEILADSTDVKDVVNSFYKWYESFIDDEKRAVDFLNTDGSAAKLDIAKLTIYHEELMKSGFVSQTYIEHDLSLLKGYEAEWAKNNENGNDGPLTGLDYDRVFCGQDWDIAAYTSGAVRTEVLDQNLVAATIEASKIELEKENGKWFITKITCE